jgi:hypothetical protein
MDSEERLFWLGFFGCCFGSCVIHLRKEIVIGSVFGGVEEMFMTQVFVKIDVVGSFSSLNGLEETLQRF